MFIPKQKSTVASQRETNSSIVSRMNRTYEPDSDDDSIIDEEEVKVDTTASSTAAPIATPLLPSALQFVEVIEEEELVNIASQVKNIITT